MNLEVLVEEPSAKEALQALLPRIVPGVRFEIISFDGKENLLRKLPHRLRDYSRYWASVNLRIVVLVDRDDDDCVALKGQLLKMANEAGLPTEAVVFRIVIEELEAWFLGDIPAVCAAYPRMPADLAKQAKFRDPEIVPGGTWEALWYALRKHGYYPLRFPKSVAAAAIAPYMDVESNTSKSFQLFRDGLRRLVNEEN